MIKNINGHIVTNILILLFVLAIIGFTIYCVTIEYQNGETIEITVKDKYVKRKGESDLYLVATEEGETYKIEDLFFKGKFNSTDLYNELDIGEKYKVEVTGARIPFFSMYKNINTVELLEEN